jgi:hypothetical protein
MAVIETFEQAVAEFEAAEDRGDAEGMRRALDVARRLKGLTAHSGTGATGRAAAPVMPTEIRPSTAVSRPGPPPRNSADPHCDICRCSYPGSNDPRVALLPVHLGDRTIIVCGPCRRRKNLVAA